ncbi:MAG: hypothetical protein N2246_06175, partial [Candidatus Sumerlaeia bacterium]|nr:hypothetical protein [Candidatus Sumerlaeia bacterium]
YAHQSLALPSIIPLPVQPNFLYNFLSSSGLFLYCPYSLFSPKYNSDGICISPILKIFVSWFCARRCIQCYTTRFWILSCLKVIDSYLAEKKHL